MQKYHIYTGDVKYLSVDIKYSHYENGRLLAYSQSKPIGEWRMLTPDEINNLSMHERHWYNRCRNEINLEYLTSHEVQEESIERFSKMLDIYEENLKRYKAQIADKTSEEHNG